MTTSNANLELLGSFHNAIENIEANEAPTAVVLSWLAEDLNAFFDRQDLPYRIDTQSIANA